MTETIEISNRLFGRYVEMHALVMRQSLEITEAMHNVLFAICKVALKRSEESLCGKFGAPA